MSKHILIIGGGNMGMAIAEGFLRKKDYYISIKTPTIDTQQQKVEAFKDRILFAKDYQSLFEAPIDIIILAVKPKLVKHVIQEDYAFFEGKKAIFASVAAGISYKTLVDILPKTLHIIRAMPNMPVAFGEGNIGYYSPMPSIDFEKECKALGSVHYFSNEEKLHIFTALAGSGPAYIFHIVEALVLAAEKMGFSSEEALSITKQMVIGSTFMFQQEQKKSLESLRKAVTSPKGTTEAGLRMLMQEPNSTPKASQMVDIFYQTLKSATDRSYELAQT